MLTAIIVRILKHGKALKLLKVVRSKITNALMILALEQMGDKFTEDAADKLKAWVLEEKIKLREQKKI